MTPPSHGHACSVFNFSWCGVDSWSTAVHQAALHVYLASVTDILHCQKPPRFPSASVFGMMLSVICSELNSVSFEAGAHGVSSSCICVDALTHRAAPAALSVLPSSHLWSALQFCESCSHSAKGSVLHMGFLLLGLLLWCLHLPALVLFSILAAPPNAATRQASLRATSPCASFSWCSSFSSWQFFHHYGEKRQAAPEVQAWEEKEPVLGCWLLSWLCCSLLQPAPAPATDPLIRRVNGKSGKKGVLLPLR